ncbi:MAG: hypothetical protein OXE99_03060 [Cellvibrionales bacterium]|nr:hypothetical protein [Cellvibrionales bacterium]
MKKILCVAAATLSLGLAGCSITHSVAVSDISGKGKPVSAKASTFNFLQLIPMSMDKSAQVASELNSQCQDKGVNGITTKTSSTNLLIGVLEKVEAKGYCNP